MRNVIMAILIASAFATCGGDADVEWNCGCSVTCPGSGVVIENSGQTVCSPDGDDGAATSAGAAQCRRTLAGICDGISCECSCTSTGLDCEE